MVPTASKGGAAWEERSTARIAAARRRRNLASSRRIVDAALEILRREGLDGLTVQAVVDRAGVSLRAFYQRFAGKDDLLLAVFEETIRDAAARFREALASETAPLARLRWVVKHMFQSADARAAPESVPLSREHLRLAEARPDELRVAIEPFVALLEELVAEGMAAGVLRPGDPRRVAVLIHHLVSAQIHGGLLGTIVESDAERSGDELWEFCFRAIRADAPPAS